MIYEYQCDACSVIFEVRASLAEKEKGLRPACPSCGSEATRQIIAMFAMGGGSRETPSFETSDHSHGCPGCSSGTCSSCGH